MYVNKNLSISFSFHSDLRTTITPININRYKILTPFHKVTPSITTTTNNNKQSKHNKINSNEDDDDNTIDDNKNDKVGEAVKKNNNSSKWNHKKSDIITIDTEKILLSNGAIKNATTAKIICKGMCQVDYLFGGNKIDQNRRRRYESEMGIHVLDDLSPSPPAKSSWIENCPKTKNKFCLNMIRNNFPPIKLTISIPFKDNAIMIEEIEKIKIVRLSVDATFEQDVFIMLDLINMGLVSSRYRVVMGMCLAPEYSNSDKSVQIKNMKPNIESKFCFQLPMNSIFEEDQTKTTCEGI